jgi:hypothetical protein
MKFIVFFFLLHFSFYGTAQLRIYNNAKSPRTLYGEQKLKNIIKELKLGKKEFSIFLNIESKLKLQKADFKKDRSKEAFTLFANEKNVHITGSDETGILYGCLAFAEKLSTLKNFPRNLILKDAPEMVLRGQCIGLQKSTYLPGRGVYEYPYTPGTFPWFYDKKLWIQVLDSMLENRMNSLYLWNGHPFASLVKLNDYPYAVEVDEATFIKNVEIFRFITSEADKRGIWVIQMFYNIIVSKPFAEFHHIKTQDRERPIVPLIADYTRKSIAAFIEKYPNVGLMVCLGEAMEGTGNDDIEWFTKTILPGIKDGMKVLGLKKEPPVVLRAHDTNAPEVMKAALPIYKNLYTEAKFNGEALTIARPRGEWAQLHQTLSKLGTVQIENVHILANLEPFRYGAPDFIKQCVIGMHEVMGGNGLHLYPQASYWDWPYSADSTANGKLLQIERDWIWYKAWGRYAWKAQRDSLQEKIYWSRILANHFGCTPKEGEKILLAYEASGSIAPKLLRRFGITDGNRQTLSLGMLMTQLLHPKRYGLFTLLYDCESPEGEMLNEYADKEWRGETHTGETPVQIIREVKNHALVSQKAITSVTPFIGKNKTEFLRFRNDMDCYYSLAMSYTAKATAALFVLQYKYNNEMESLDSAKKYLTESIYFYSALKNQTNSTYRYANSMQTQQRKIPMRGVNGTYKHWREMLPVFEQELKTFQHHLDTLHMQNKQLATQRNPFENVPVSLLYPQLKINKQVQLFSDTGFTVTAFAKELLGLKAMPRSFKDQIQNGTRLQFSCAEPVKLLVGFFITTRSAMHSDSIYLPEPELETNAGADAYGQAEIKILNAIQIQGMPPVNLHTYTFTAGTHDLQLPKGVCLLLGFISEKEKVPVYNALLTDDLKNRNMDWLFE